MDSLMFFSRPVMKFRRRDMTFPYLDGVQSVHHQVQIVKDWLDENEGDPNGKT